MSSPNRAPTATAAAMPSPRLLPLLTLLLSTFAVAQDVAAEVSAAADATPAPPSGGEASALVEMREMLRQQRAKNDELTSEIESAQAQVAKGLEIVQRSVDRERNQTATLAA